MHPLPAKSCKGCLYYSNMRAARGGKPFCLGLSRKEEAQELRGPEAGKERQARQEFKYACVGYSVWEDGTSASGPDAGAQMPAVLCMGLEFIATKDAQEATSPSTPSASTQGDPRKESPFPTPRPTTPFPAEDFRLRFQRSAGRLAEHTFNNLQKIGTTVKESVSSMLSQDKGRPKS
ncbi:hypothetical protein KFL_002820110 [Klebsormidium nitens]|uniref:DUF8204 domain-containing protein n=1 Tax=Klebsormidium nitens TaxID=105231 RepID=A0A1Y1IC84_KLENI|nr:hypothetical protein KFL_002820110 [Klebsormidium nitens]|eukprot:GAQ86316.1 hypothetical protein KFL_002820110 [Klebsormidium nitens]